MLIKRLKEFVKATKVQEETAEIRKDLERMENDLKKLDQRIEKQSEKVTYIQNKEALLVTVRSYRYEHTQQKKLSSQIKEQKESMSKMETKLKQLKTELVQQKAYHLRVGGPIEKLHEELQVNKMIIEERLKSELRTTETDLDLLEAVINDPEPANADLEQLEDQLSSAAKQVQELMEKRVLLTNPKEDKLAPFRQQANIIANQKQLSTDKLVGLKTILKQTETEIQEKQTELERQVGGKILHGDELKNYVNKLRSRSVTHKETRGTYQALVAEVGVLTRTLEILKSLDGELASYLEKKDKLVTAETREDEMLPDTSDELQEACTELVKRIDGKRAENAQDREELSEAKRQLLSVADDHEKNKRTYDEATGELIKVIGDATEDLEEKSKEIEDGESKWKILQREIKRKENILNSISEEIVSSVSEKMSTKDLLAKKVEEEETLKMKLSGEIGGLEMKQNANEDQVKMLRGLIKLLKQKMNR